jgi:protoporphyrinogen oxidase
MPSESLHDDFDCVIVGGGFTGIAAALRLSRANLKVLLLEREESLGGLAGSFEFRDGVRVEKYYHHWFRSDHHLFGLLDELGLLQHVRWTKSKTGSFLNKRIWRLSSPLDLIRFTELSLFERMRLGFVAIYVRVVRDFRKIEGKSISEWLVPIVGTRVFDVVWRPLVDAKFGKFSEEVSAAWMWKKLVLRGGSRKVSGSEELAYFDGGFGRLNDLILEALRFRGIEVRLSSTARSLEGTGGKISVVRTDNGSFKCRALVLTTPQPIAEKLLSEASGSLKPYPAAPGIPHLANICLVMSLKESLSDTYWLNVTDPGFPFVGVIEHTNLDTSDSFRGNHIVYLSRYLDADNAEWALPDEDYFEHCLPYLIQMFPKFHRSWIVDWRVWRTEYAQPVTVRNYSAIIPRYETWYDNVFQANMAQIYPEDRGTNYAVRGGSRAANLVLRLLTEGEL